MHYFQFLLKHDDHYDHLDLEDIDSLSRLIPQQTMKLRASHTAQGQLIQSLAEYSNPNSIVSFQSSRLLSELLLTLQAILILFEIFALVMKKPTRKIPLQL